MNSRPKICAVSGDPGGAEALAPVLAAWSTHGDGNFLPYRQARAVFAAHRLPVEPLDEGIESRDAVDLLRRWSPDLLVTSTSVNDRAVECTFTAAARVLGIPSLAVLDFWSNYRRRFLPATNAAPVFPDWLAVMDGTARDAMIDAGLPSDRAVITGQPAWDSLVAWRNSLSTDVPAQIRGMLGAGQEDLLVVFASQPISEVCGADASAPGWIGFSEVPVLAAVVDILDRIRTETSRRIVLVIRPHPREEKEKFARFTRASGEILVSGDGDRRAVAVAADLIVGMNSAFLLEAAALGAAVLSVQPGLILPDPLPTNLLGLTRAIYRDEEIAPALRALLLDETERAAARAQSARFHLDGEATSRVLELIHQILSYARNVA